MVLVIWNFCVKEGRVGKVFQFQFIICCLANKKGEGCFSFTFLRREISPAKDEQQSLLNCNTLS